MRLVCPNCAAQYEVDDSVIPNAGRDVQCSSCGQMWFQPGKAAMRDAELEAAAAANAGPEPDSWDIAGAWEAEPDAAEATPSAAQGIPSPTTQEPAEAANPVPDSLVTDAAMDVDEPPTEDLSAANAASPAPEASDLTGGDATASSVAAMIAAFRAEQDETETEEDAVEDAAAPPPLEPAPRPGTQPRRALDDSLLSILREEAEREARARRTEGSSLETQEELNLTPGEAAGAASAPAKAPTAPPAEVAPAPVREPAFGGALAPELMPPDDAPDAERVAHYGTEDDIAEPSHAAAHASGRERLPDIEEINSTLRAASDRSLARSSTLIFDEDKRERSGFRFGFSSVMVVALIAFIIYSFAPQIAEKLPAAGPTLEAYVVTVDEGRLWLDAQLQRAIDRMQASQNAQP